MKLIGTEQEDAEVLVASIASIKAWQPTRVEKMEMDKLRNEVRKALLDLKVTQNFFELADEDQVEYAIYAMLAAERRYGMLLSKARDMNVEWSQYKGVVR